MSEFDLTVNNAEISYENCSVEISSSTVSNYNLKKASGIAVIKNNDRIQIANISGSRIMIGYALIQYEDSSRFNVSVSNYILNNGMSVKLGNSVYSYFLMLLFWNTY